MLCAGLGGEHAEDGGTAANVEDDLVLEEVGVVVDGIAVALGADLVFLSRLSGIVRLDVVDGTTDQHLLVDTVVVVGVEVVAVQVISSVSILRGDTIRSFNAMRCYAMRRTPRCGAC
jgi:hypothetical protein